MQSCCDVMLHMRPDYLQRLSSTTACDMHSLRKLLLLRFIHLSCAVLGRAASATALLVWCSSISTNIGAVRFADILVSGANVQAVLRATSLALCCCLCLLWACLVGVEGSVRVCGAVVRTRLCVFGRSRLQRIFVLCIFLSEACWCCAEKTRAGDSRAGKGCALYCACGLDAEHGDCSGGIRRGFWECREVES
jgi:hypothetical protein